MQMHKMVSRVVKQDENISYYLQCKKNNILMFASRRKTFGQDFKDSDVNISYYAPSYSSVIGKGFLQKF